MTSRAVHAGEREDLLRHLRLCYWRTLNRLDEALEASSLTARQFLLLQLLEERGPCNARTICAGLSVTPADVTGLSTRLEHKHLLRRLRSTQDRRQVILEITEGGKRALAQARRRRDRVVNQMVLSMSPGEFQAMLEGLSKVLQVVSTGVSSGSREAGTPESRTPGA